MNSSLVWITSAAGTISQHLTGQGVSAGSPQLAKNRNQTLFSGLFGRKNLKSAESLSLVVFPGRGAVSEVMRQTLEDG